jgi:hypothetical protein
MPSIEILIKDRDLISLKGYFQSNRGRWHTSVRPTNARPSGNDMVQPAQWKLTGAPRYMAMVLRFRWFLFLRNRWSARNSPRGSSTGKGLQCRTCDSKVQASTFGDGRGTLQGSAHDTVGPNGCGAERRTPTSG